MRGAVNLLFALALLMTVSTKAAVAPVHVKNHFQFTVNAPLTSAAHFFGPEGERCWAGPHWDPVFLYPSPAKDTEGAIFTVQHGPDKSVWANTLFDLEGGRMQYVSFLSEKVVSIIDVRLTALDASSTRVDVTYARTALNTAFNDEVEAMGRRDGESGPHWQHAIAGCLAAHSTGK